MVPAEQYIYVYIHVIVVRCRKEKRFNLSLKREWENENENEMNLGVCVIYDKKSMMARVEREGRKKTKVWLEVWERMESGGEAKKPPWGVFGAIPKSQLNILLLLLLHFFRWPIFTITSSWFPFSHFLPNTFSIFPLYPSSLFIPFKIISLILIFDEAINTHLKLLSEHDRIENYSFWRFITKHNWLNDLEQLF